MHSEYIVTIYSEEDGDEWSDSDDIGCLEYYEENPQIPIYYSGKERGIDVVELAEILLDENLPHSGKVAKEKPTAVSKNLAFVMDNRHFRDAKDILSDSLGSWICTGTKTFYCTTTENRITLTDSEHYGENNSIYKIERRFYKNKAAEDVKRNFGLIKGKHFIISLSDYCFRSKFEEGKHTLYLVNLSS